MLYINYLPIICVQSKPAGRTAPLNLSMGSNNGEAWVIHSGVVIVLAKLLPALPRPPEHEAHARALRDYLAHVLKSLVRRYVIIVILDIVSSILYLIQYLCYSPSLKKIIEKISYFSFEILLYNLTLLQ